MGDMADGFKELKEFRRKKRNSNMQCSTEILIKKGIEFESKNDGVHLVVKNKDATFDFYPSTGLFIDRNGGNRGRGIKNLLKKLGV